MLAPNLDSAQKRQIIVVSKSKDTEGAVAKAGNYGAAGFIRLHTVSEGRGTGTKHE